MALGCSALHVLSSPLTLTGVYTLAFSAFLFSFTSGPAGQLILSEAEFKINVCVIEDLKGEGKGKELGL